MQLPVIPLWRLHEFPGGEVRYVRYVPFHPGTIEVSWAQVILGIEEK